MNTRSPMPDLAQWRVLICDAVAEDLASARDALQDASFNVMATDNYGVALNWLLTHPIQCAILHGQGDNDRIQQLCSDLDRDSIFGRVPVILILNDASLPAKLDWPRLVVDDFLIKPFSNAELLARVRLCLARSQRDINSNPLTGLPGNTTIMREAQHRLMARLPFAMGYLDIDHFKAFNDKYGFARGDEVLRMTARILINALHALHSKGTYLGHVGGDDFVFLTPPQLMPAACEQIVRDFDEIVQNFYDQEDRTRGKIESFDRKGGIQDFPLMTCSVGIVDTEAGHVKHLADLSARLAQVKSFAKQLPGSNYLVDRRR